MAMDVEIKRQSTSVPREFHRSKRITMAETECKSVEAKEALNYA